MSCATRFRLLRPFPLIAMIMLGCGTDDNTDAMDPTGSAPVTGGQSTADAGLGSKPDASTGSNTTGNGSGTTDAGSNSMGGAGSKDAGSGMGNQGNNMDGGAAGAVDASGTKSDASSPPPDAGKQDASDASNPGDASGLPKFSFFVTSEVAIRELSKDPEGFGGDLRYGETGDGAGLRGADKLCTAIAERSMPGSSAKQWRAFLSASSGGAGGGPVHARDRIGQGPWYDRKGRLVGNALADLINGARPSMADPQIRDDLPNETGTSNSAPDGTKVDNHDTLTGSDAMGRYVSGSNTCMDWTSSSTSTSGGGGGGGGGNGPQIGHSWPRGPNQAMNWIADHRAGGCGKGINTMNGSTDGTPTVGSGGGYGGFYCFALTP